MREDPVFHAGQKDDGKLEPLGSMQRHQRYFTHLVGQGLAFSVGGVWELIGISHQGHLFKEIT